MYGIFKVDYNNGQNQKFFDKNDNIKYNVNMDMIDMDECFFVSFIKDEEEAKKFCDEYNKYNKLCNADEDIILWYYSYCNIGTNKIIKTIIEVCIEYDIVNKEITIYFIVHHSDFISSNPDKFIEPHEGLSKTTKNLFIIPNDNESLESLEERCLNNAIDYIKNNNTYNYKDFLKVDKEYNIGGVGYIKGDFEEFIHLEDKFKE